MCILMQFVFWGSLFLAPALGWWALALLIPSGLWLVWHTNRKPASVAARRGRKAARP